MRQNKSNSLGENLLQKKTYLSQKKVFYTKKSVLNLCIFSDFLWISTNMWFISSVFLENFKVRFFCIYGKFQAKWFIESI